MISYFAVTQTLPETRFIATHPTCDMPRYEVILQAGKYYQCVADSQTFGKNCDRVTEIRFLAKSKNYKRSHYFSKCDRHRKYHNKLCKKSANSVRPSWVIKL